MSLAGLAALVTAAIAIMAGALIIFGVIKLFKGNISSALGMIGGAILVVGAYGVILAYTTLGPAVAGLVN